MICWIIRCSILLDHKRAGADCSEIVEMVGWEKREEVWIVVKL